MCARGKGGGRGGGRSKLLWVTPRASAVGAAGEASRGITLGWSGVGCGASLRGRASKAMQEFKAAGLQHPARAGRDPVLLPSLVCFVFFVFFLSDTQADGASFFRNGQVRERFLQYQTTLTNTHTSLDIAKNLSLSHVIWGLEPCSRARETRDRVAR